MSEERLCRWYHLGEESEEDRSRDGWTVSTGGREGEGERRGGGGGGEEEDEEEEEEEEEEAEEEEEEEEYYCRQLQAWIWYE